MQGLKQRSFFGKEGGNLLITPDRLIQIEVKIQRPNDEWVDVTEYINRLEVSLGSIEDVGTENSGVDGVVRRATVKLANMGSLNPLWDEYTSVDETHVVGDELDIMPDKAMEFINLLFDAEAIFSRDSFSPRDSNSQWNQPSPLLWPNRKIEIKASAQPIGEAPVWNVVFVGLLGDIINVEHNVVTLEVRDLSKRLMDTYIEEIRTYGSEEGVPAETVIQQILDDNLGEDEVILYCPVSPGFMIQPYKVDYTDIWSAIQQITQQIGWYLGYRFINGKFRLAFLEPPREKSIPDFMLDYTSDIYVQPLDISDRDIRNVVQVAYRDSSTGERESVTVKDDDSISTYGRRACSIEEADTSLIDTEEEALAFANAVLHDLSGLTCTTRIDMPFFPELDLFSTIQVYNPLVSSTYDFYAVQSIRHTLDFETNRFTTEIIASGRVVGGYRQWLRKETRPGSPKEPIRREELAPGSVIDGSYIEFRFRKNTDDAIPPVIDEEDRIPENWGLTPPALAQNEFLWMSKAEIDGNDNLVGEWSTPVRISGVEGDPGAQGEQGEPGPTGPGVVYRGDFDAEEVYYNRTSRRDIVKHNDSYYLYKGSDGVAGEWDIANWDAFGDTFDMVATDLLLAHDVSITKTLTIGDGGTIIAGDGTIIIDKDVGLESTDLETGSKMRVVPGGLVYINPEGEESDYLRSIKAGEAVDGEPIQLNFEKPPKILLSEMHVPAYFQRYNTYSPEFSVTTQTSGSGLPAGDYDVCVTSLYGRLEANPKNVQTITVWDSYVIDVQWSAVLTATGYNVYWKKTSDTYWKVVQYVVATSYTIRTYNTPEQYVLPPPKNETGPAYLEKRVYAYNETEKGFTVRAQAVSPGQTTNDSINTTIAVGQSYTTAMLDTVYESITSYDAEGYISGALITYQGFPGSTTFTATVRLDLLDANNVVIASDPVTFTGSHENVPIGPWQTNIKLPFRLHISPPAGSFKARLTFVEKAVSNGNWNWNPTTRWSSHTYTSDELVYSGAVNYIAIDGGSY